jgi:hypothetical protein
MKGPNPHRSTNGPPASAPLETPRRNVHKYLIGRDGRIARGFCRRHRAMDARVLDAIMKELPPLE